jgi:hypothetical protein
MVAVSACCSTQVSGGDGNTDIIWRNTATDVNAVWFLPQPHWYDAALTKRDGRISPFGSACASPCWRIVATADFNRDGQPDLLWRDQASGQNAIWLMQGTNVLVKTGITAGDPSFYPIGVGDVNGDGYPDIIWRPAPGSQVCVWYMNNTNLLASDFLLFPKTDNTWIPQAVGDFNNDGNPDIFLMAPSIHQIGIWYLTNGLTFAGSSTFNNLYPSGWTNPVTGRFNMVGNTDLVWRNPTTSETALWWLRNDVLVQSIALPFQIPYGDWEIGGTGDFGDTFGYSPIRELRASLTASQVILQWRLGDNLPVTIQQRPYNRTNQGAWSTLTNNWLPYYWTNTLTPGQRYEYKVGSEYLLTAIAATPVENRGKVILIVDNRFINSASNELELLHTNLVGDGWTVVRTNVPPHDDINWSANTNNIASIKSFISNTWSNSPLTNLPQAILLIGHVPMPHSGNLNPDGHGLRCLPADTYYGDVDGVWTDTNITSCTLSVNCTNAVSPDCSCGFCDPVRHNNLTGDGKWDQKSIPRNSQQVAALEMAVGRIDFANLPSFVTYLGTDGLEVNLLRRYLLKDDGYRQKRVILSERVMTGDYFDDRRYDQSVFTVGQGLRIGSRLFGFAPDKILNADGLRPENGSTWAVNSGSGAPYHMEGYPNLYHSTTNIPPSDVTFITAGNEPHSGFYILYGSCFVDYGYPNNLMRGLIAASPSYNLGAMWYPPVTNPNMFEQTALGEPLASGILRAINESGVDNTYMAWLGDPTLRVQILAPASSLRLSTNGSNVQLSWTSSVEASQYFVYRSTTGIDGGFSRITADGPISGSTYTDTNAPASAIYMVRALALKTTASGSFTNLSQGVFASRN